MRITGSNPVAQRTIVTLKYSSSPVVTAAVSLVPGLVFFRMNGLFDPEVSLGGHQPYGFDTYATLYARYRVWRCKWRVVCTRNTANANVPIMVTVLPFNSLITPSTFDELNERPRSVSKMLGERPGGHDILTFKGSISLPYLNGVRKGEYGSDDRFQALVGADPAEAITLGLFASKLSGAAEDVVFNVTLWYTAEFFDPLEVAQS